MNLDINGLFPVPVVITNLNRDFTEAENLTFKEYCNDVRENAGNMVSNNSNVLDDERLFNIKEFIQQSLNEYVLQVIQPQNDLDVYITQSWLNVTSKDEYHHKHAHPNSYLSGVLYIKTDEDGIKFFKPYNQYQQLKPEIENWNLYNSESWWFDVSDKMIVLFPSYLEHMVETKQNNSNRISLSFNTFINGNLGTKQDLTHLTLNNKGK